MTGYFGSKAASGLFQNIIAMMPPHDTLKDVIIKVRRQKEHILTFIKHEGAPHHNNYGEYIIKKGVVKRKMSDGSMPPKAPGPMLAYSRLP
jgi:hypothetical protein